MLLLLAFAVKLKIFPIGGYEPGTIRHLFLPCLALGLIPAQISVDPTPGADGSFGFQAVIPVGLLAGLPFGKHLLYFFQAPPPPANATQAEIDAHYRAFASIATTPTSRIEVPLPPLPLTLPASIDPLRPLITAAAPILSVAGCALQLGAGCAQPRADVNIRDGARLWTTRASDAGDWQISLAETAIWSCWLVLLKSVMVAVPSVVCMKANVSLPGG